MPTIKQKQVFRDVLKGSTISGAMVKAGYSPTTASTTGKLTNSDGWKELLDKHIPDKKLAKVLDEGLQAGKSIYKDGEEVAFEKDFAVRHKYLETGLKLKNRFPKELPENPLEGDLKVLLIQINNVLNTKS